MIATNGSLGASMVPIRILLAHDHRVMRQALRALLELDPEFIVVGEVSDGRAVGDAVMRHQPDVLVLGLAGRGLMGGEIVRQVRRRRPGTKVLVLSPLGGDSPAFESLHGGTHGHIHKHSTAADLTAAIRAAVHEPAIGPQPGAGRSSGVGGTHEARVDPFETLTPREREVLFLAAEGFGNVEIGRRLRISPRTVETHRGHLMQKMGFRGLSDVIRYAIRRGILPHDEEARS